MIATLTNFLPAMFRSTMGPGVVTQLSWVVFRVIISTMMIHNGMDKLEDIESFAAAYVEVIGLPFPIFFAYIAAFTELLGAPLVALGLFTRPAAFGLFSTMCVAMYHHILVAGLSIPYLELSAVYAVGFLFFAVNGPGIYSADAFIGGWLASLLQKNDAEQRQALENSLQATEVVSK
ncbi:MAG: DoxX family protein [Cyanobacteria bacterium J06641_5]